MFEGVHLEQVDIDEAHIRILEGGLGGGGEIGIARADADHQVGVVRDAVGSQGAGGADGAQAGGMVVCQRAFAGLGFAHGDAGLACELIQRSGQRR